MKQISAKKFEQLTKDAVIVSRDKHGPKVYRASEDIFIKVFRLKSKVSSARLNPYAKRFAANAEILKRLSIPTVKVLDYFAIPEIERDAVVYNPLQGETLRDAIAAKNSVEPVHQLAPFVAMLHEKGILFRSIHWANILICRDGTFGLIDISDLRWRKRPLGLWERYRNFKHMSRYEIDRKSLRDFGVENFLAKYFECARLNAFQRALVRLFRSRFRRALERNTT